MIDNNYLVFDIETYPDKRFVEDVYGKSLPQFRAELNEKYNSNFLPTIFHIPIAVSILKVGADYSNPSIEVRTATIDREPALLEYFWMNVNEITGCSPGNPPTGVLVSFNGSDFDLRVLEQRALKYGLTGNTIFRNPDYHFDVPAFLSNFQAGRRRGLTLETVSKLVGLAGKTLLRGEAVEKTYDSGNLQQIGQYCMLDVLQTYLIFLRCQLFLGLPKTRYEYAVERFVNLLWKSPDPSVLACRQHLDPFIQTMQRLAAN